MAWGLTSLGVALAIILAAGAALAIYRRYCFGWQWGARNIWSVCEEWRQRLSWLWAPREEKVGLVKAQNSTAQTVPGLYKQAGNTSQYLLHSESDLRLNAQGTFTRFEAVDRDLHPPLGGGSTIPPQPLRPAPQPRPMARPRPSPLQAPSGADYLKLQEAGPGPLTPPPQPRSSQHPRPSGPTGSSQGQVFLFQTEASSTYGPFGPVMDQSVSEFESFASRASAESIQMTPYKVQNQVETRVPNCHQSRYEMQESQNRVEAYDNTGGPFRPFDVSEESSKVRYSLQGTLLSDGLNRTYEENYTTTVPYGNYDIIQRSHGTTQHPSRHVRNESRGSQNSFGVTSSASTVDSIYGPQIMSKILQSGPKLTPGTNSGQNEAQNIEMIPFKNSVALQDVGVAYGAHASPSKIPTGLQRVSQYVQNLPDNPIYEANNHLAYQDQETTMFHRLDDPTNLMKESQDTASGPVPPPAPPDPPTSASQMRKNGPTTGERIFKALRSVTSQSYIDASEFYNSVISSAQQVQRYAFPPISRSSTMENANNMSSMSSGSLHNEVAEFYDDRDAESMGQDTNQRSSDLYSPELNLEAHRTAQEVYNSLQDPPSSPLLLKDHNQEPYPYLMDPSFTRTSEDIFNSLEHRRKSMERINGYQDFIDLDASNPPRRQSSQDLFAALEEVQLKRRLSQSLDETCSGFSIMDIGDLFSPSRRESQGSEFETPDETNLKRAISCDSVCSDTSVVIGDLEKAHIVGHVCVGLEHERWGARGADGESDLTVSILEAKDLVAADSTPAQDTFARVCLLPDRQTHVQTRLCRRSPSPSYQEKFLFPLDGGPVGRTLLVEIFSVETNTGGGASLLGEASLKLTPTPRPSATTWLPLIGPSLPVPHLGELLFSLSYLPTAERLTLVVVKARNLRGSNPIPGDFFVKVYLLQQGKKLHKKKTSVKKGEKSPIFNEAIIFNVPAHALQNIQLRLTVAEVIGDAGTNSKTCPIGHVIVGSSGTGKSLAHWRQMLAALRRPVAMWHPLRK
ncbi:uncharacterized protein LOC105703947 [Orussus abietinus]|uniref:uncharacterized protein LOC105703947 n=1 Tax=Orussus abietinus TaxID=222816 RepID=UPI000626590E|nr:uncharacterized protein LOC105703947 [Orussus abietinus]